jgi:hypothetical protein
VTTVRFAPFRFGPFRFTAFRVAAIRVMDAPQTARSRGAAVGLTPAVLKHTRGQPRVERAQSAKLYRGASGAETRSIAA